MKPTDYAERTLEVSGWQLKLTSYQLNGIWHAKADNVSPGAWLARTTGETREAAEEKALERAEELLSRTRVRTV